MSQAIQRRASSQAEIRRQLRQLTEPHTKSRQADGAANAHTDGENIHQDFGVKPLHKWLHRAEKQDATVARFPRAFIDLLVYTDERDLELLDYLAGDVEYDPHSFHPTHPELERYRPYRAKVFEWLAAEPHRVRDIRAVKGTDLLQHGEPGGGKTTLGLSMAMWQQQINNATFIWADTVDESGTNERTEWLAFAGYATVAIPEGLDTRVRIVPADVTVDSFEVAIEDICREVIRYTSVDDLMRKLTPGQFTVVYPDPLLRGCREVSKFAYHNYEEVTPAGEDGPDQPTDADHWWFAFIAHRISGDRFVHPTWINIDEAGNLLDADAEKDVHQHYNKIKWFRDKYADARKKGVSFGYQVHSLSEMHRFARQKIRWRCTMPGNAPPIGKKLPGDRRCPIETDITSRMPAGQAAVWKAPHFCKIKWPNLKRSAPTLDAEVSIDFVNWQEAVGGGR